jgi:tetratricopeptide (TPR) repeat protein
MADISGYNTTRYIEQYNLILNKYPNVMFALINLTDKLIKVNRFREAEKYAKKAYLLYHEENDMTVVNYSVILFYKKKVDEAIAICEGSISGSINDMLYNNLGFFYMHKGDHRKALLFYNKSIMLNKKNASAYCNRGILRHFILNENEGINDIIHAIDLGDDEAEDIIKVIRWGATKDYS